MGKARTKQAPKPTKPHRETVDATHNVVLVSSATCCHGIVRKGHGIDLTFTVNTKCLGNDVFFLDDSRYPSYRCPSFGLDFCGDIYKGIPVPGAESLALWMLPLKMNGNHLKTSVENNTDTKLTFTLGAKQLSRETLERTLENLRDSGDPFFSLDMIFGDEHTDGPGTVLRAVTKASLMLASLAGKSSNASISRDALVNDHEQYDNLIRSADARRNPPFGLAAVCHLLWLCFLPILFVSFSWWLVLSMNKVAVPASFVQTRDLLFPGLPRLVRFGTIDNDANVTGVYGHPITAPGIELEMPPLPKTRTVAFELGSIWAQLGGGERTSKIDDHTQTRLYETAAVLLQRPKSSIHTVEQLTAILANLRVEESKIQTSVAQRVYGLFSTVNIIWLVSIIGICVSIGPSVYYTLKPLRAFFYRCWRSLLDNVLEPLVRKCHQLRIFELGAWVMSWWVCVDAYRFYGKDAGRYIGITGTCFSVLACIYTMITHGGKITQRLKLTSEAARSEWFARYLTWYATLSCLPLCLIFESDFLSFVAVGCIFWKLGFGGMAGRFCYVIGFSNDDALMRCAYASTGLLLSLLALRVFGSPLVVKLSPLHSPISIFGSLVLYVALLIVSSKYYFRKDKPVYLVRQGMMCTALLAGHTIGSAYGFGGLVNSTSVFMVLYFWTKSIEISNELKLSGWLVVLFTSLLLWRSSLYLHTHPSMIVSMFTGVA
jgi:hypothetical protein